MVDGRRTVNNGTFDMCGGVGAALFCEWSVCGGELGELSLSSLFLFLSLF